MAPPGRPDVSQRDDAAIDRRLARLREELADERIPLPLDGPAGARLLTELTYARRPPRHEQRTPTYGALVFDGVPDWDSLPQPPVLVDAADVPAPILRRLADGRSSFTVATPEGITALATFDRSFDDELTAVRLQRSGAIVIQRNAAGLLRACTPSGVVSWDGSTWGFKPLADDYVALIAQLAPHADRAVASGLLELAVHALAARRIGATLVWNLDEVHVDDPRDGAVDLTQAVRGPALSVARRAHFPALVSLHAQTDLATIVAADGSVGPVGARLEARPATARLVPPLGGARHTSARRLTFDVPTVLAVVVSESGRVTVFSGGAVAARIAGGRRAGSSSEVVERPPTGCVPCPTCAKPLLLVGGSAGSEVEACPVCSSPVTVPTGARFLGVAVVPPHGPEES